MDKTSCLRKLLEYEETVFQDYLLKRSEFKEYIHKLQELNKEELFVFVNDLKAIVDPIKTSTLAINHCLNNSDFKNTQSISDHNELQKVLMYYILINGST